MTRLAILGSGNGTNAQQITEYFAGRADVEIACIIYNVKDAYIAQRAKNLGVESRYFGRKDFYESSAVLDYLKEKQADWVILAGFLWLVPENMLAAYPNHIINIHHSFLPAFVGAKPYHQAWERGVKIIGATSHYVTAELDAGPIIEQDVTRISHKDTPESLVLKGKDLEKIVLSHAVSKHIQRKILTFKNKTIIFS